MLLGWHGWYQKWSKKTGIIVRFQYWLTTQLARMIPSRMEFRAQIVPGSGDIPVAEDFTSVDLEKCPGQYNEGDALDIRYLKNTRKRLLQRQESWSIIPKLYQCLRYNTTLRLVDKLGQANWENQRAYLLQWKSKYRWGSHSELDAQSCRTREIFQ